MKTIVKIILVVFALAFLFATYKAFAPSFSFTNPLVSDSYEAPDYATTPDSHGYDTRAGYAYYSADSATYLPSQGVGLGYQANYYDNRAGERYFSSDFDQYGEYTTSNKAGQRYYKSDFKDFAEYNDPDTGYRYYSGGDDPFEE